MRALSFLFALMVGLVMAFLAPALASSHGQAPMAMGAPEMAGVAPELINAAASDSLATDLLTSDLLATDPLAADQLSTDLLAELSMDPAPGLDIAA